MHELYELREKLCHELKKYSGEEVTANNLNVVDTLSHSIKNLDKIIEKYEAEERGSYGYNNRANRGNSYARGRGSNAKRDSMGRYASEGYSRSNDIVSELRELMMDAPDEETKQEYHEVISKLEMMM